MEREQKWFVVFILLAGVDSLLERRILGDMSIPFFSDTGCIFSFAERNWQSAVSTECMEFMACREYFGCRIDCFIAVFPALRL